MDSGFYPNPSRSSLANSTSSSQQHFIPRSGLRTNTNMPQPTLAPINTTPNPAGPSSPSPTLVHDATTNTKSGHSQDLSLSVNYIPSKFSAPAPPSGARRRKRLRGSEKEKEKGGAQSGPRLPKMGGGVDAFRSGERRMPAEGEEEEEEYLDGWIGVTGKKRGPAKLRWNRFKWALFVANVILTIISLTTLLLLLLTWFNVFEHGDIIRTGNTPELVLSTIASLLALFTSLLGWAGILLNNRSFLATYTFLLFVIFAFEVAPGYITYKRREFNLEGKVNAQWSRDLGVSGRLTIQNALECCGYFSPFVEATVSQTCYSRSILPGCKLRYLVFERVVLKRWYTIAFALVPVQLGIMLVGLLCSNHVTYRFGKGMMPKAYRLSLASMAVIMDNYANQLAEQYGDDVASEIVSRSKSNLGVYTDTQPPPSDGLPYTRNNSPSQHGSPGFVTANGGGNGGYAAVPLGGSPSQSPVKDPFRDAPSPSPTPKRDSRTRVKRGSKETSAAAGLPISGPMALGAIATTKLDKEREGEEEIEEPQPPPTPKKDRDSVVVNTATHGRSASSDAPAPALRRGDSESRTREREGKYVRTRTESREGKHAGRAPSREGGGHRRTESREGGHRKTESSEGGHRRTESMEGGHRRNASRDVR